MIVRKPYAFLIKNFRIIHGILFLMLIYIGIRSLKIYSFFDSYAKNHYFTPSANLVSNHINIFMFVAAVLIILFSAAIFYLLSVKKKNRSIYLFLCLYYIGLIVYFIYILNLFNNLSTSALNIESVRAIRDIALIVALPQPVFMTICLVRTLGFNLKKFEFKKDLQDLQIDTSDYEEVEVTVGKNNYKYSRLFRKSLRLTKYFILENKFFVTIIASIIVLSLSILLYINIKVENEKFQEGQRLLANSMWYNVTNSYYTQKSSNGSIIKKGSTYLLIEVQIDNKTYNMYSVPRNIFRLEDNNELKTPIFNLNREFIDLGTTFNTIDMEAGETKKVLVVYEVKTSELKKEYIFKIKNSLTSDSQFKNIIVKPKNIDNVTDNKSYNLPCEIDFSDSSLKNTKLTIDSVEINSQFREKQKYCLVENKCYDKMFIIESEDNKMSMMKINTSLIVDETIDIRSKLNSLSKMYEYFGSISYQHDNELKNYGFKNINDKFSDEGYIFIEIPNEIEKSNKIDIIFNIRDKKYAINLK